MKRTNGAFTMVEMVVSISIITIITGIMMYNYPQFNRQIYMNYAAREFSLALRDAQNRASSVTALPSPPYIASDFPKSYALHITKNPPLNNQYILYSDRNQNKKFDLTFPPPPSPNIEVVKTTTFANGVKINAIRSPDPAILTPNTLNVIYSRPDPKTTITDQDLAGNGRIHSAIGPFEIDLISSDGTITKTVKVWTTGQISIQ